MIREWQGPQIRGFSEVKGYLLLGVCDQMNGKLEDGVPEQCLYDFEGGCSVNSKVQNVTTVCG